ncbi:MAG: HlyD family type I secretion periplasmic adaptor subunit [Motiliproteus sp.]|nr:HlyD family type I secretion periplasmic adaptor subunit [Motiliproteus sp.]MCW9052473.1 HlyD family type I secretion periplasmic adaptor subunit [Motiliproteus sp.]
MSKSAPQSLPQQGLESFVDNAAAASLLQAPGRSKILLWVVFAFVVAALAWASWAKLDEVTVGEGRVIPSQQLQVVQNLEGGIVDEIFVAEGELVNVGQSLLRIDDTRFNSDFRERQQQLDHLLASVTRLRTELASVQINQQKDGSDDWRTVVQVVPQDMPALFEGDEYDVRRPLLEAIVSREQSQLRERLRNLSNQLDILERQIEQRDHERLELRSKIGHLNTNYKLVLEELKLTRPLAKQGVVPRVELIKLEREVNKIKSDLDGARLQLPKVRAAVKEDIAKRREAALQHRSETQERLAEMEAELAQLREAQVGLKDRVERTLVVSPVNGIIKKVAVSTVGGVVQPGMDLVEIVPAEDNLVVEAKILPKDIAFLRPGLSAVVRFSAYDFSIYGGLEGQLEHISADSIEDEQGDTFYLIRVRTDRNHLGDEQRPLPIIPGMVASVDVITGKKTVLDYLLKPILRAQQSALRER